jgi:hypothetical protein
MFHDVPVVVWVMYPCPTVILHSLQKLEDVGISDLLKRVVIKTIEVCYDDSLSFRIPMNISLSLIALTRQC